MAVQMKQEHEPAPAGAHPDQHGGESGCQSLIGYRVEWSAAGVPAVHLEIGPQHLNRVGQLHGGVVATVLDVACGHSAIAHLAIREGQGPAGLLQGESGVDVVTVALNLSYISTVRAGKIIATAQVAGGGKTTLHVQGRLETSDGHLLATATGVFRRIRKSATSASVSS